MNSFLKGSLSVVTIAAAGLVTLSSANAGGLLDRGMRGSMKDAPRVQYSGGVSRCYIRGDVGYSVSGGPSAEMDSPNYATVDMSNMDMGNAWMGEIGAGCGSGSRGFRADLTLGYRGERDIDGNKPAVATPAPVSGVHFPATLSSKVSTLTAMANFYYDFGKVRGFVPYVGAGIGVARHKLSSVSFDFAGFAATNPVETIGGSTQTNFAWSLMAGAAYQISDRAVLDFGYRYIDMGDVSTRGNICNTCVVGGSQDRLNIDDITAHEFKVGLRIHFSGRRAQTYK
ncbi:MAG: opacity protein-like surface antigen [Alphaproteobacteria bacterium]|jgi:opacity protein-like surface antigen